MHRPDVPELSALHQVETDKPLNDGLAAQEFVPQRPCIPEKVYVVALDQFTPRFDSMAALTSAAELMTFSKV